MKIFKRLSNLLQMLWWVLTAKDEEKEHRDYHDQILSFAPILHENIWYVEGENNPDILPSVLGLDGFVDTIVIDDNNVATVSIVIADDTTIASRALTRDLLIKQGWKAIPPADEMSLEKLRGMLPINQPHATLK